MSSSIDRLGSEGGRELVAEPESIGTGVPCGIATAARHTKMTAMALTVCGMD